MATTTTIAPTTGAAPSFTQAGTGSSPGYSAIDVRRLLWAGPHQEGVIDAGSYMVVQRAAGANLSVDVNASTGNGAVVQGDSVTSQGLYFVPPHSAVINLDVAAADATNPRIDSVYLEVKDDTHDSGGLNIARVRYITGTATSGATLTNRTGAASNPGSALLLADVLVAATDTAISNSEIRDRRPWARGAFDQFTYTGGNKTIASSTLALIDSTNLNPRIECSGVPLRLSLYAIYYNANATSGTYFAPWVDGAAIGSYAKVLEGDSATTVAAPGGAIQWVWTPSAGSHQIGWAWAASASTSTMISSSTQPIVMVVEEIVRQNSANNSTTSG